MEIKTNYGIEAVHPADPRLEPESHNIECDSCKNLFYKLIIEDIEGYNLCPKCIAELEETRNSASEDYPYQYSKLNNNYTLAESNELYEACEIQFINNEK